MSRDTRREHRSNIPQRSTHVSDAAQPYKRLRYADESAASSIRSSSPIEHWADYDRPIRQSDWSGRSDPSWKPVGLPIFKNTKNKWVQMETPSYLTMDEGELGAQRASTQNLINGKSHRDTSTLKMMQTILTRLCAVRTNTEVKNYKLLNLYGFKI